MPQPYRPTPAEVALLIFVLIQRYIEERGKEVTRLRLARRSLRRIAIRSQLRDVFIEEWADILHVSHGWLACSCGDEFVLVRADTTQSWPRIGTSRMNDIIKKLRRGDRSPLDEIQEEIADGPEDDEED